MLPARIIAGACVMAIAAMPAAVSAQPGDSMTVTGTAQAEMVNPGRLLKINDLRFGALTQPTTAGTLVITPAGAATGTGEIAAGMVIPQPATGRGPAQFRITGTQNRRFNAIIPNKIDITNGTATMRVSNITTNLGNGSTPFPASGEVDLFVGGTLNVNANQAPGHYSGIFQITVIYQ